MTKISQIESFLRRIDVEVQLLVQNCPNVIKTADKPEAAYKLSEGLAPQLKTTSWFGVADVGAYPIHERRKTMGMRDASPVYDVVGFWLWAWMRH